MHKESTPKQKNPDQIWFKKNKGAEKYTAENIISIYEETYEWLQSNPKILLKKQVDLYMLTTYGVSQQLRSTWLNSTHINNKSFCKLHDAINLVIEIRMVYDREQTRPSVQGMVLQNEHNYREKRDINENVKVTQMPSIEVDGKPMELKIGD